MCSTNKIQKMKGNFFSICFSSFISIGIIHCCYLWTFTFIVIIGFATDRTFVIFFLSFLTCFNCCRQHIHSSCCQINFIVVYTQCFSRKSTSTAITVLLQNTFYFTGFQCCHTSRTATIITTPHDFQFKLKQSSNFRMWYSIISCRWVFCFMNHMSSCTCSSWDMTSNFGYDMGARLVWIGPVWCTTQCILSFYRNTNITNNWISNADLIFSPLVVVGL